MSNYKIYLKSVFPLWNWCFLLDRHYFDETKMEFGKEEEKNNYLVASTLVRIISGLILIC
jgi:hypothetical protein